jgi:Flp pilus assembly protein TadD
MDAARCTLRSQLHSRFPRVISVAGVFASCLALAAWTGDASRQPASATGGERPTRVNNESVATTDSTYRAAPDQEIGQQCLLRGTLALSSSATVVQAISEFHCALTFAPEQAAEGHRGLGAAYAKIGDVSKAIQHYRAYLDLKPQTKDRHEVEAEIRRLQRTPG